MNSGANMIAFMFPGQGSQKRGMGQSLFDEIGEYRGLEPEVDAILGYSLRKLCLEDTENRLKETQYTQPALYVVNALHWYQAVHRGERPRYAAGHSLGEYNALLAAGVFDFLTGLRLVQKRGALMSRARDGGMAAVVGLSAARISEVLDKHALSELDVANYNSPSQTVVSGGVGDIKRAGALFEKAGAKLYMPLQVSAAFHSRYMSQAATAFAEYLNTFTFNAPALPVIANATGRPYPTVNPTEAVRSLLSRQIHQSVLWTQSVRFLMDAGVTEFRELGPGNVLTRLVQQIQQDKAA